MAPEKTAYFLAFIAFMAFFMAFLAGASSAAAAFFFIELFMALGGGPGLPNAPKKQGVWNRSPILTTIQF